MAEFKLVYPTKEQAEWADCELGVIIHMDLETFDWTYKQELWTKEQRDPATFAPMQLDTDQWIETVIKMGGKYAVLVAKHCTGFCLWPTEQHDYSIKKSPWKDGKGDIVGDFFKSCKKYGVKPGLYYSASYNGYMGVVNPGTHETDPTPEKQQAYNEFVIRQLTELWTWYGDVFEIWFDGGCLPVEKGGPDITSLLHKLQPDAVVFQGPEGTKSLLRWVGNERATAAENCSSIMNFSPQLFDGTVETPDKGDTFGDTWCPAESDMPNRDAHKSFLGGWFWRDGEDQNVFSAEHLFDTYLKSVGRNTNMLIGMVIDNRGLSPDKDVEEFTKLGKYIKDAFSVKLAEGAKIDDMTYQLEIPPGSSAASYIVIGEDITQGERVYEYSVTSGGTVIYEGSIIGHKKIIPIDNLNGGYVKLNISKAKATPVIRFFDIY